MGDSTRTFQRFVIFLNVFLLAVHVVVLIIPDRGMAAELLWFGLFALQFLVPVISIFALLPPKQHGPPGP